MQKNSSSITSKYYVKRNKRDKSFWCQVNISFEACIFPGSSKSILVQAYRIKLYGRWYMVLVEIFKEKARKIFATGSSEHFIINSWHQSHVTLFHSKISRFIRSKESWRMDFIFHYYFKQKLYFNFPCYKL